MTETQETKPQAAKTTNTRVLFWNKLMERIEAAPDDLGELPKQDGRIEVTPALALQWLRRNRANRRPIYRHIDFLMGQLRRGLWRFNGQSILFSDKGDLLDGQHRLAAIVATGIAAPAYVILGIDPAAFATIDSGRGRDAADALSIHGVGYSTHVAVAIRTALGVEVGGLNVRFLSKQPVETMLRFAEEHPRLVERAQHYAKQRLSSGESVPMLRLISPGVAGFLDWRLHEADAALAAEFMRGLIEGTGLETGSPILAVRNALETRKQEKRIMAQQSVLHLCIRGWNAWRNDEPTRIFYWPQGGLTLPPIEGRETPKAAPTRPEQRRRPELRPPSGGGTLHLSRAERNQ